MRRVLLLACIPFVLSTLSIRAAAAHGAAAASNGHYTRPVPVQRRGVTRRWLITDGSIALATALTLGPEPALAKAQRTARLPGSKRLVSANESIIPGGHLTWGEATKNLSRWPTSETLVANAIELAQVFEQVRAKNGGKPLEIISGYRPPHINRRVRGARNSQHILFKALDVAPLDGDYAGLLKAVRSTRAVKGIGVRRKRDFVHMDIRDAKRVTFKY